MGWGRGLEARPGKPTRPLEEVANGGGAVGVGGTNEEVRGFMGSWREWQPASRIWGTRGPGRADRGVAEQNRGPFGRTD